MRFVPPLSPIQRESTTPIYLQIANQLILLIRRGVLPKGYHLPGSRQLADELGVQRGTVNAVYEELAIQGWIEIQPRRGAFVSELLPEISPRQLSEKLPPVHPYPQQAGFEIQLDPRLEMPLIKANPGLSLNDGFPDIRLAPVELLGARYRSILQKGVYRKLLSYGDIEGNPALRRELSLYLNETRGVNTSPENIMIIRGSQMGIFLLAQTLTKPGDKVVVGETNYHVANAAFNYAGAELLRVPVDHHGICINEIEAICEKHTIRAVYVTSHHHYPTTASLCADRRIRLLDLAQRYRFAIVEDDYHYDFHYNSSPILPLASADTHGNVAYVGSFSKSIAPSFRIGYIVAPQPVIKAVSRLRRIIDRQGDQVLEQVIAELLKEGELQRHLKKMQRIYQERRDYFCDLLDQELAPWITFKRPSGGLAVWAQFNEQIVLPDLAGRVMGKGLYISNGTLHNPPGCNLNAARLGFAALTPEEMNQGIDILKRCLKY